MILFLHWTNVLIKGLVAKKQAFEFSIEKLSLRKHQWLKNKPLSFFRNENINSLEKPKKRLRLFYVFSIPHDTVEGIDRLVQQGKHKNRSQAIQNALKEYLQKSEKQKLYAEIDKLDQKEEMKVAEEGFDAVNEIWEDY